MRSTRILAVGVLAMVLSALGAAAQPDDRYDRYRHDRDQLSQEVRDAIARLPNYGVFDSINFRMRGDNVTLGGYVSNPVVKEQARNEVREIAGIGRVVDRIQVLPTSQNDDRLRRAVFRAIYSDNFLSHYGTPAFGGGRRFASWGRGPYLGMEPLGNYAIHIVVDHGRVALFGVVSNETDRRMAEIRANGVLGVFGVENNLQVESRR